MLANPAAVVLAGLALATFALMAWYAPAAQVANSMRARPILPVGSCR
ncbi:MAG TPA: hypothetical protein VLU92_03470 [Candidatus Dormibacteraeota bacterium]|nr:hypothetical protein [Candidatus Dormibacteraeota bacterium]